MDIEFDPAKDKINRDKHGVSLAFGERVFGDPLSVLIPTIRIGDEEWRFKAVGTVDGRLWTVVHVSRGLVVRFISVRRSNDGERRVYDRA